MGGLLSGRTWGDSPQLPVPEAITANRGERLSGNGVCCRSGFRMSLMPGGCPGLLC